MSEYIPSAMTVETYYRIQKLQQKRDALREALEKVNRDLELIAHNTNWPVIVRLEAQRIRDGINATLDMVEES